MNNYIILENRAELTTAQVLGGMNFSAIVAGAASASSDASGKSFGIEFMSKGFLAVLIVVGGMAVYKNYVAYDDGVLSEVELNSGEHIIMRKGKGPLMVIETIPPKSNRYNNALPNAACQPGGTNHSEPTSSHMTRNNSYAPMVNVDSLNALAEIKSATTITTPAQMVIMPQQLACRKEGDMVPNGMTEEKSITSMPPLNLSPNAKSYLWNPASFNHNVDEASGDFKLNCNVCEFDYISGSQLDNKNYKGVWMRVTKDKKVKFQIETGLKNISLIRIEGSKVTVLHPIAIGIDGPQWREKEWTYLSNKFKTKDATYRFGDHIDFYFVFENARVGDRLVIDDFVETVVVEK
ncbi:MAG: hypothetical protein KA163_01970 [Bacteroidia bacterium]|nr:hypothetical protein [Bacteroidia bacterium]